MPPSSRRRRWRRAAALAALVAACAAGCTPPPDQIAEQAAAEQAAWEELAAGLPGEPAARLRELLRRGAEPGALPSPAWDEIERLLPETVLPATEGALAGQRWRVTYIDLPLGDFVAAELIPEPQEADERTAWVHVFHRRTPADPAGWDLPPVAGFPARGMPGHHLFVLVGDVEVRAVAASEEMRREGGLRELLESFSLEILLVP